MKKRTLSVLSATILMACSLSVQAQIDKPTCGLIGFANYRDLGLNGTTGGGQGEVVKVTTREQLEKYAADNTPRTIIIENDITGHGNIGTGQAGVKDFIVVGSNKTIVGAGKGITLNKLGLDANGQQNIILRNLRITNCNPDALAFRKTHHVWVDHCDLASCDDGLLDFTLGSSYLSVSWTKFSDHNKVSICNSGTNHFEDNGKQRVTYHHCWFDHTTQRNPRVGYGLGHIFNNYYTNNRLYCVGYHTRAKVVVENSLFKNTHSPLNQMYRDDPFDANYADALSRSNRYVNVTGNTKDTGVGFDINRYYNYAPAMTDAANVEAMSTQIGLVADVEHDLIPFPGNYASDVLKGCQLHCGAVDKAKSYTYWIGKEGSGKTKYVRYSPASTLLSPSTDYVWYARVATSSGKYTSGTFHFTTASEKAGKPLPADGDRHARLREALKDKTPCTPVLLRWREAFDAQSYRVYLSKGALVDDHDFVGETPSAEFSPGALTCGQSYAWRVDAVKANGEVVKGDTWTFSSDKKEAHLGRTEMEDAVLNGVAYIERSSAGRPYSGTGAVVGEAGPGCMSVVWADDDMPCDITTTYFDWQKGHGTYTLYVNEERKDSWTADVDGKNLSTHTSKNILLKRGDEIRIDFCTDGKQRLRTDCIDIVRSE